MTLRRLIENIDTLYTCDSGHRVLRDAHLVTEDGRIAALGEGPAPDGAFDERIDLAGCIAMPGLVNVHHHFFQTLTRAIPGGLRGELIDWLRLMYPLWAGMTPADLRAATAATAGELLLTGATTSVDHAYCMPGCDPAFVQEEVAAAREAGLRLHLVRGSMTEIEGTLGAELSALLGPGAGGIIDDPAAVLADMRRSLRAHHDTGFGSMVTVAPGPTVVTFDNLDFMREVAALAREFGTGLHAHFHPRPDERVLTAERYGRTPIEVMDDIGWLGPRTWFAHSTRMEPADMVLLGQRGVGVAHCPRMIMRLGVRITRVHDMVAHGMRVAVGVDGGASNDSGSMLGEMRIALLLHRLAHGGSSVPSEYWLNPYDILLMATREAASMIGRSDIGQLAPGLCADVTAFDMRGIGFAGARTDLLAGLLLAGDDTRAALTMVGGEVRARDGRLLGADEHRLRTAVDSATARLIEEAARKTRNDYFTFPPSTLRGLFA
jgi:cytosine/adenosine deaminase-related metal-dependent hydrolase